ncbi:MAG TPA: hypothetical protein VMZ31_01195 [Phycisphaerae bacterium]|nr:hypothetical protein [Phycisphaerae bacterium]
MNTISASAGRVFLASTIAAIVAGVVLTGCAAFPGDGASPGQIARAPTQSDIVEMVAIYDPFPWLFDPDDDTGKVVGIRIRSLFLISGKTKKGVFGDGTLRMTLYVVQHPPGLRPVREKLYEWQFEKVQAVNSRVAKKTWMGYGYMFDLPWSEEMDLTGREIALGIDYIRTDGKLVRERPKYFQVMAGG